MHLQRAGVVAVDLVDDNDWLQAQRQRFAGDEPGLRHGALGGVNQQQHPIHHSQDALHFATEVRVARGIDDIDLHIRPAHGGVLR
jgi:hypothetical protein